MRERVWGYLDASLDVLLRGGCHVVQEAVVTYLNGVPAGDERLVQFSKQWAAHRLITEYENLWCLHFRVHVCAQRPRRERARAPRLTSALCRIRPPAHVQSLNLTQVAGAHVHGHRPWVSQQPREVHDGRWVPG